MNTNDLIKAIAKLNTMSKEEREVFDQSIKDAFDAKTESHVKTNKLICHCCYCNASRTFG